MKQIIKINTEEMKMSADHRGRFVGQVRCPACGAWVATKEGQRWTGVFDDDGWPISMAPSFDIGPHKKRFIRSGDGAAPECPGWHGYWRNARWESV